jgi:drug/metabolite transporter (DMT)-like permease
LTPWLERPALLLAGTGACLGLYFPLGKLASSAGVDPIAWSLAISLFPGLILLAASAATDRSIWSFALLPFGLIAGITAYVIPNSLTFAAIPHVGSGYMSLMFALSPVFTAILSVLVGVRPPNRTLLTGVALGFLGALLIVFGRASFDLSDSKWPLIALVVPASLAVGNVYRTAYWPKNMSAQRVGAAANLGAVPWFLLLLGGFSSFDAMKSLALVPALTIAQLSVSLCMFLLFFRLQWVGGPTYLSQIGYVAAAVGLFAGSMFLGESYSLMVWVGTVAIAAGFAVSNWPTPSRTS